MFVFTSVHLLITLLQTYSKCIGMHHAMVGWHWYFCSVRSSGWCNSNYSHFNWTDRLQVPLWWRWAWM